MSQYVETNAKSFPVSGAIGQNLRVKTPSSLAVAGATDVEIGTLLDATFAAGERGTVQLRTASGTVKMVAAGEIAAGATVYAAASGKIDDNGTIVVGTALEAATGDGSVIEVLRSADTAPQFGTQSVTADDSESALNQILPGVNAVVVSGVTNDANDFVVLPALADVPNGWEISIIGSASSNFEVRTPASSNQEINSEDCDGTKEYLFTDTQIHRFVKINNTIGWMAQGFTAIGAVATAVVPD